MFHLIVLFSLVGFGLATAVPRGIVPMLDGRIVGGETVVIEKVPWQISLKYYGSHRCGGSVHSDNIIITAAHCVDGTTASSLEIVAGTSFQSSGGEKIKVSRVIVHPRYDPWTIDNDIAVLILVSSLRFSDKIQPVSLPEQDEPVLAGSLAQISGWGALKEGGGSPNQLQSVDVTVVTNEACAQAYKGMGTITDGMMCAGEPEGGRDSCQGDSGGPVVVNKKLVGVVSWGYGCARKGYPGVYARVATYRSWVNENTM